MMTIIKPLSVIAGVVSLLSVAMVSADTGTDMKFVTGTHWTQSTDELRKAYLYGIGNMLEMEQAMQNGKVSSKNSMVPVLVAALSPMTLDQVEDSVTDWFGSHPDQAGRTVIDVLYTEIALPQMPTTTK